MKKPMKRMIQYENPAMGFGPREIEAEVIQRNGVEVEVFQSPSAYWVARNVTVGKSTNNAERERAISQEN